MTLRRAAAVALATYAFALAITAIPPAFRPAPLRAPIGLVQRALRAFGIVPGLAVFETGYEDRVLVRQDCIRVVARDTSGAVHVLAPPGDRCVTRGVRAVVPWTEGGMRAWVLRAPAGVAEPALGDWVCRGPLWGSPERAEVTVIWTQPWVELRSGREGVANAAYFVWRCEPPGLTTRVLRPTDAALRAVEAGLGLGPL